MNTISRSKRNILKRILGLFSFTSALFIFQACYGTPQDLGHEILIQGKIKSEVSNNAIEGIEVYIDDDMGSSVLSDDNGQFTIYTWPQSNYKVSFNDPDSTKNGQYASKDTVVNLFEDQMIINFDIKLSPAK